MRTEPGALLGEFAVGRQAENLKATAIGEYRFVPVHEFMQTSCLAQQCFSRTQIQMISVAKNYLGANIIGHITLMNALDRTHSTHRHENGCKHSAMVGLHFACARC